MPPIRTHHTGQTSPTLGDGGCSRNPNKYFPDVTFNYFYSDSRKVPRIKSDLLTPVNWTPYDSWCIQRSTFLLYSMVGALSWRQARNFIPPRSRYRSCGKRVTDSSQAVIHLFSRLRSNRHNPCVQYERATLPILNHMAQTFSLVPVFRLVLSKGASKAKIVWHLVAINFGYEYFCHNFFSKFFLQIFFQNFFSKFFSQNFFFQIFFSNFFLKTFFSKFFLQIFFPKIFFSKFFQNFFCKGFTLDASPFTKTKRTICICVMKNQESRERLETSTRTLPTVPTLVGQRCTFLFFFFLLNQLQTHTYLQVYD